MGDGAIKLRLESNTGAWEHTQGWSADAPQGAFAIRGPGGPAIQYATGYTIHDGIAPAGSGEVWTAALWVRTDEPEWGVWQGSWSSGRDPNNMYHLAWPMIMHLGTFLSHKWELRLCRNMLEVHVGDWVAAGTTELKVGRWTHVAVVREGQLPFGWATVSRDTLYLHVFKWPGPDSERAIVVHGLHDPVVGAGLLATGQRLEFQQGDGILTVRLPEQPPDPVDSIVALEMAR